MNKNIQPKHIVLVHNHVCAIIDKDHKDKSFKEQILLYSALMVGITQTASMVLDVFFPEDKA